MEEKTILQSLFLFRNAEHVLEALTLPEPIDFEKGAEIYAGGDYQKALGVVIKGRAEATRGGSPLSVFQTGDTFGAAAIFGCGDEYVSVIRAVTPCRIQFIPEETLRQLFAAAPQTAVNYVEFLSRKIRFLNGKIATYTADNAEGRLYHWLSTNCDTERRLPEGISMTKLAKILHIGRTSLYRALDELEKKQLIERKEGEVRIL